MRLRLAARAVPYHVLDMCPRCQLCHCAGRAPVRSHTHTHTHSHTHTHTHTVSLSHSLTICTYTHKHTHTHTYTHKHTFTLSHTHTHTHTHTLTHTHTYTHTHTSIALLQVLVYNSTLYRFPSLIVLSKSLDPKRTKNRGQVEKSQSFPLALLHRCVFIF